MFELFKNPNVDFMGRRNLWLGISAFLMVASLVAIPTFGIKRGIELGGGAEIQVKMASAPDLGAIRSALAGAGFESHSVTTIGAPGDHEVYIRIGLAPESKDEDVTPRVVAALRPDDVKTKEASGLLDVNTASLASLTGLFEGASGVSAEEAAASAGAIVAARNERAIFRSVEEAARVPGVATGASAILGQRAYAGPLVVRSQSYIGPAIGRELINKAVWAILGSLAGMLGYIWFRFQFRWGIAAVVALVHDTVITLGLFTVMGYEMNLPVVASFLTLIGYSVNDKVVVFDRMRENLSLKAPTDLVTLINDSMNQALSRTILTSSLTWLATIALYTLGGPALRDFSFPLMIGIVIGTYSSMYTAAPFLLLWQRFVGAERGKGQAPVPVPAKAAKKVRAGKA